MTEAFATANGHKLASCRINVGNVGPWDADCVLTDAARELAPGSRVEIVIGKTSFRGTIVDGLDGTFGLQHRFVAAAGGDGWGKDVEPKGYHNDAGVKARLVAEDLAREVGETLGNFVPANERIGAHFVRTGRFAASAVLSSVIGDGVAWWVDYNGLTQVGLRPEAPAGKCDLLAFNPRTRIATLHVDDPAAVGVGSILDDEKLDAAYVVRGLEIRVSEDEFRVVAWTGGSPTNPSRLAGLLTRIARRATDGPLWGKYRYRVVSQAGDGRVELQAVRAAAGLPDAKLVAQWPGVPGAYAELQPGAECLVEFIEGDAAQPIVTGFAGPGGVGFVPAGLTLGGTDGSPAARIGDVVEVLLPPATATGVIGSAPFTGVIVFASPKTLGQISSGSSKVKVAS
jgi:hypothetical protein